jgi:hypothetical protein
VGDWDLHARMATESLIGRVRDIQPLCHAVVDQRGITRDQIAALDSAVHACRWIIADFDAQNPDRDLPMPRCVAGLFDFWLWVNRLINAAPREEMTHA